MTIAQASAQLIEHRLAWQRIDAILRDGFRKIITRRARDLRKRGHA